MLLTLTACILFFILGSKLATYKQCDWQYILQHFQLPNTSQKSLLTGYPVLFLGAFVAAHWLKFNPLRIDKSALAVPIGLAVQQSGCLFAGCCGGYVSNLPWSIQYDKGSILYNVQMNNGLLSPFQESTLHVHPAPLYMIILLMISFLLLLRIARYLKTPGSIRFSAIFLFICCRFIVEFFRDPSTDHFGGEIFWGIKKLQWALLMAILVVGIFIFFWEKIWKPSPWKTRSYQPDHRRTLTFLIFLFIIYFYALPALDTAEKVLVQLLLVASLLVVVTALIKTFRRAGQRSLAITMALTGLLCLGQSYRDADLQKGVYTDFNFGSSFGHYYNNIQRIVGEHSSGCGGTYYDYKWYRSKVNFKQATAGFSIINVSPRLRKSIFDLSAIWGGESEHFVDTNLSRKYQTYRISTAYRYESKGVGFTVGFHGGNTYFSNFDDQYEGGWKLEDYHEPFSIYPILGLRIGTPKIFYFRSALGGTVFFCNPLQKYSVGIGTGFGKPNYPTLEIGLSGKAYYAQTEWAFSNAYRLQVNYINSRGALGLYNVEGITFGLSYRTKNK